MGMRDFSKAMLALLGGKDSPRKKILCFGILGVRFLSRVLFFFPIDESKYLFSSDSGKSFSCSPRAVFEALYAINGRSARYVWRLRDRRRLPDEYRAAVTVVNYMSPAFFFHYVTAKYIIINSYIPPFLPKRRGQVIVETWHGGGAYKLGGHDLRGGSVLTRLFADVMARDCDYFLSSCARFSAAMESGMGVPAGKLLPVGLPRNDMLFDAGRVREEAARVRSELGIPDGTAVALYAPTFRGGKDLSERVYNPASLLLDTGAVLDALGRRFGRPFRLLVRQHPPVPPQLLEHASDVTGWPDMQGLLCAADFFITDYSSAMWDSSLLGIPGALFVPDLEEYAAGTGGFYMPPETWPYPHARTNGGLLALIEGFDAEEAEARILAHHDYCRSYESGTATRSVLALIS